MKSNLDRGLRQLMDRQIRLMVGHFQLINVFLVCVICLLYCIQYITFKYKGWPDHGNWLRPWFCQTPPKLRLNNRPIGFFGRGIKRFEKERGPR